MKFQDDIGIEVFHTVELIEELIDKGELTFESEYKKKITYHDPCHLGRHMKFYEIPREVIKSIPGVELVEMKRNRENAWCCGAGGGVKIGYPEWAIETSKERLEEAISTGASIITSICPFCRTNLTDANNHYNLELQVLDLLEIIESIGYKIKE